MAKDFLSLVRSIGGSQSPEEPISDGIYWDIAIKLYNSNPGMYGDIVYMYNVLKDLNRFDLGVLVGHIDSVSIVANDISNVNNVANDLLNIGTVASSQITLGTQFLGTSVIKGVQFMSTDSALNEQIVVPAGTHAFSVGSFTLQAGTSLTVGSGSVYKII